MIKEMKKGCISFLVWAGCQHIIRSFWQALEITVYGAVQPRDVDTIISVLFSLTLWRLVRDWYKVMDLCRPCACAIEDQGEYHCHPVKGGVDNKVLCERCGRKRYGMAYRLEEKSKSNT